MNNYDNTLGQIAFEKYAQEAGGLPFYGRMITDWHAIGPQAQAAFYAAALAVVETVFKNKQQAERTGKLLTGVNNV